MSAPSSSEPYQARVVAYCCTYCAYAAADLAGSLRREYPPDLRVVRILCTGKVDALLLLRAFEDGADAVYVAGCARGDCHFLEGNLRAIQVVERTRKLLAAVGLEPERLEFFHIPASAGPLFAQRAREMVQRALELEPNPLGRGDAAGSGGKLERRPDREPPLPPARYGHLIRHTERRAASPTPIEKEDER